MSVLSHTTRLAALALTGAAFSVTAITLSAAAHAEGDRVFGPVASVSGNTFEVNASGGTAAVAITDTTRIRQSVPAQRGELTVGSCVTAGPGRDAAPAPDGELTAKWLTISDTVDGKCPQRPGHDGTPPPAQQHRGVRGVVSSVSGDTVTVTRSDNSTATVTINDTTHYRKRIAADQQAVTPGKCVAARGAKDGSGVLQATSVTLWDSDNGNCPHPGN